MASRRVWVDRIQCIARAEPRRDRRQQETLKKDDLKKTGLDRKLIALDEPHEVRSWTEALGITEKELQSAVAQVGNSAEKVREFLRKK